jgi:formamidopyrimidine-DNA glycosylase
MLEIPESRTIALQAGKLLTGRTIVDVLTATSPHKFAFYCGDPSHYVRLLSGRRITSANGHGMFVDLHCDKNSHITIGDGTNLRYYAPAVKGPEKHQLLLALDDGSCLVFTIAMYGGIWAYKGTFDNTYHQGSLNSVSPLDDDFDASYFNRITKGVAKDISLKALLATEQRIPGLGNGVLQDILFNARLHPKRKRSTLSDDQIARLFGSLKATFRSMTKLGGRDTDKDLFGRSGGYKTLLSKNTMKNPCPNCHAAIVKEAYLGGAIYFCPECQRL